MLSIPLMALGRISWIQGLVRLESSNLGFFPIKFSSRCETVHLKTKARDQTDHLRFGLEHFETVVRFCHHSPGICPELELGSGKLCTESPS